ncbi:hypothetical protein HZA76_02090 [Candidatus Roizmanbacteria bacterium]|nr:hypothetical protein [Candidatus Roizmanbacteria bacterium]
MNDMKEILNKLRDVGKNLNAPKNKSKKQLFFVFAIFLTFFVFLEIFFSQQISPVFFGLVNNDRKAIVEFLREIRTLPQFSKQLNYFESVFGSSLKTEVFSVEKAREEKIKKLEQMLEKNTQSRDILYSLYLLYKEKGDSLTAGKYLQLAKQVDPLVK